MMALALHKDPDWVDKHMDPVWFTWVEATQAYMNKKANQKQ